MTDDLDVTKAIAPKSDQLNGDDLLTGPRTIRIRDITQNISADQQKVWIYFDGDDGKPWKPCKTMLRALAIVWKTPKMRHWIGKHVTLFRDPEVVFGASKDGGIRVSHAEGLDSVHTLLLTAKRGKKGVTVIKPLEVTHTTTPKPSDSPKPTIDRAELKRQMDEIGTDAAKKKEWWGGLTEEQRAVVKELASSAA